MAQLDPLLQALIERNAEELVLTASERPAFRFGEELRAVSQQALSQGQIGALLQELSDQVDAANVTAGHPVSFVYRLPDGSVFSCDAEGTQGAYRARFLPNPRETASVPVVEAQSIVEAAPAPVQAEPVSAATVPAAQPLPEPAAVATPPAVAAPAASGVPRAEIERYLLRMVELDASDLHMSAEETPMVRRHGDMVRLEGESVLNGERTLELFEGIMPERNREEFSETGDTDFAHEIPGVARFRVNLFMDRKGPGAVFRVIPAEILTAEQLGLSKAILDLCELSKGLVLVTGPTGSGKSTTLAAMIDHINRTRSDHIITIEDPVEFVHPNRKCLVNQREVHNHTQGFKPALRAALREDPDIVLVGEMRDLETIAIAIETAETGHLVFGTLHTTTAISTVDRIIDQFPADRQAQIRTMLSESIRGVVSQTLLKKIGGGRVAALETLIITPAMSNLIREGKTFQIASLMQTGRSIGQVLLTDALADLVKKKLVEPQEAYRKAIDKASFLSAMKKMGINIDTSADD